MAYPLGLLRRGAAGAGAGTHCFRIKHKSQPRTGHTREPDSVSQSVISRSRPALTPPPARSPAPPLPVKHKYRVLAPGGYSIVASPSEVNLSQRTGCSLPLFPDSTHNELKHTITRKTATHERSTPDKPHVHTHTHTSRSENDANQQTTPPRIAATLPQIKDTRAQGEPGHKRDR